MCRFLEISKRTYYKYRNSDDPDYLNYLMIKKVFDESNGITISMARKGTPLDDAPIESWHALLKKTLYNNNITSLQEYQKIVEEWILFYNTTRLKSKVKKKRKTYTKREK